jgi:membrane protein
LLALLRLTVRRAREERLAQIAGSLTFTTTLALVPLLTVAFALFTTFPVFQELQKALEATLIRNLFPREMARTVLRSLNQFADNAQGLTAVGTSIVVLTAVLMMHTIENAFNQIWGVKKGRFFLKRVGIYAVMLLFGPLVLGASLWATSYLLSASLGLIGAVGGVYRFLLDLGTVVLMVLAFSTVFYTVPNAKVAPRDALVGGILAGLCFEWIKRLFTTYVLKLPTYKVVYGAFAAVPVLLLWVYFSWLLTLAAALVTANLPRVRGENPQAAPREAGAGRRRRPA